MAKLRRWPGHGSLSITNHTLTTAKGAFNPSKALQSAWNKLAEGKELEWLEEYSVESLWHEMLHNRQKWAYLGRDNTAKRRTMELVTQWTARRTYPELLADLGGTASHLATIKSEGLGYGRYINNFDSLLAALKVDEGLLLNEMTRPIDTAPMDQYGGLLADWLAKQSGHKKRAISRALGNIKEGSGIFERELKELGFVK